MSCATHAGFSAPFVGTPRFAAAALWLLPPPIVFPLTVGVVHSACLTCPPSSNSPLLSPLLLVAPASAIPAVGVCQSWRFPSVLRLSWSGWPTTWHCVPRFGDFRLPCVGPESFQSREFGVILDDPTASLKLIPPAPRAFLVSLLSAPRSASAEFGVGQALAALVNVSASPRCPPVCSESSERGVGHAHDPASFASMRRSNVISTHHDRPAGVGDSFQLFTYPVNAASSEPSAVLNEEPRGSYSVDEPKPIVPQAGPFPVEAFAGPRERDVLAGETACPNRSVETGPPAGESSAADAGEEMALVVPRDFFGREKADVFFDDLPIRESSINDAVAEFPATPRVDLVVTDTHAHAGTFEWFRAHGFSQRVCGMRRPARMRP